MKKSERINELAKALVEVQKEIKNPAKTQENKGVQGSPKYATLEDTLAEYVRPICTKHGIAVYQSVKTNENKQVGVSTTLIHESGQYIESDYVYCDVVIPLNKYGKEVLTQGQATGVNITYLRRYSLNSALGITGDSDTDGSYADREPLTLETALEYEITFGKYKGKALGEVMSDESYIEWLADKGNEDIKEAIKIIQNSPTESHSKATEKQIKIISELQLDFEKLLDYYKVAQLEDLSMEQASEIIAKKGQKNG